jgi:dolichol-phosphate mannosyltransferase
VAPTSGTLYSLPYHSMGHQLPGRLGTFAPVASKPGFVNCRLPSRGSAGAPPPPPREGGGCSRPQGEASEGAALALLERVGQRVGTRPGGAVSLVVPTRNEAGNIIELLARLDRLPLGLLSEVIFVDDSDDGTVALIESAAFHLPVEVVHREPGCRAGGLSGAVVEGLRRARGEWVCVMDADLQHPPEVITALHRTGVGSGVDLVCATRNIGGGDRAGLRGCRDLVSRALTATAHGAFPCRLRGVSDPMSGFFLARREALDVDRLRPTGFKILLEILVRTPGLTRDEVPYEFAPRFAGDSKASVREGLTYLRHLGRLRFGPAAGPASAAEEAQPLLQSAGRKR